MSYTVIWIEQGLQFCLPYQYFADAQLHVMWLLSQGIVVAYIDIEEMN